MKKVYNKKGFTLSEILITVVIVGIILVVAVSSVIRIRDSIKLRELNAKKEAILTAAELYTKNNLKKLNGDIYAEIDVNTLLASGYINSDINFNSGLCVDDKYQYGCVMNPINETEVLNDTSIIIKRKSSITQAVFGELSGIKFDANNNNIVLEYNSILCIKTSSEGEQTSTCEVMLPKVIENSKKHEIIGWNIDKNAQTKTLDAEGLIVIDEDLTNIYYLISKKELKLTFDKNSTQSLTYNGTTSEKPIELFCTIYNKINDCTPTNEIPTVNLGTDYKFVGWNTNKDSTTGIPSKNLEKLIYEDTTYYAIQTKRLTGTIVLNFYSNGATKLNGSSVDKITLSCSYYEDEAHECEITTPKIERQGSLLNDIIGWNTNKDAETALPGWTSGGEITVSLNKNKKTYYAITKKKVTIMFDKNETAFKNTQEECTMWNSAQSCEITMPIIPTSPKYYVLGWATSPSKTTADYASSTSNTTITQEFWESDTLYAIKQDNAIFTATFYKNGAESISSTEETCIVEEDGNCEVIAPTITPANNYKVLGWSEEDNATSATYNPNSIIEMNSNKEFYAVQITDCYINASSTQDLCKWERSGKDYDKWFDTNTKQCVEIYGSGVVVNRDSGGCVSKKDVKDEVDCTLGNGPFGYHSGHWDMDCRESTKCSTGWHCNTTSCVTYFNCWTGDEYYYKNGTLQEFLHTTDYYAPMCIHYGTPVFQYSCNDYPGSAKVDDRCYKYKQKSCDTNWSTSLPKN